MPSVTHSVFFANRGTTRHITPYESPIKKVTLGLLATRWHCLILVIVQRGKTELDDTGGMKFSLVLPKAGEVASLFCLPFPASDDSVPSESSEEFLWRSFLQAIILTEGDCELG
jgi:hypothetical protein